MNNFFILYNNVIYAYLKRDVTDHNFFCYLNYNFLGYFKQQPLLVVEQLPQWLDPVQLEDQWLPVQLELLLRLELHLVLEPLPLVGWLVSNSFLPSFSKVYHDLVLVVLGYIEAQDLLWSLHTSFLIHLMYPFVSFEFPKEQFEVVST